jgi:hypothetical protein
MSTEPLFHNEAEIARRIGLSVSFLRKDRRTHRVIPYLRVKGRILYSLERVREAMLAREEGGQPKRRRQSAPAPA